MVPRATVDAPARPIPWQHPKLGEEAIILRPADYLLLGAAFLSFVFSISLWFSGLRDEGLFVGIWVPSILAFGGFMRSALRKG